MDMDSALHLEVSGSKSQVMSLEKSYSLYLIKIHMFLSGMREAFAQKDWDSERLWSSSHAIGVIT